jgi:hypothetical protein
LLVRVPKRTTLRAGKEEEVEVQSPRPDYKSGQSRDCQADWIRVEDYVQGCPNCRRAYGGSGTFERRVRRFFRDAWVSLGYALL